MFDNRIIMSFVKSKLKNYTDKPNLPSDAITIIKPRSGWQIVDFQELKEYRDLFYFLVWRDIKVLYAQTIFGFA